MEPCFIVLPAFLGTLVVLASARRVYSLLAEKREAERAGRGEVEKLEVWASQHGGVLEMPWRFLAPRTLDGTRLACKVEGQSAWVEVEGPGPFTVRALVAVDGALDLEIRRPTFYKRARGSARVAAAEILPGDDEQPDVRFDVRRAQDGSGELREKLFVHGGEALTTPLVRLLYQTGADFVRAREGQLGVSFEVRTSVANAVDEALRDLAAIARAYARRPAPLALGAVVERYLWLEGNAPRCPYCHVDIAEGETDLVACDRCRTLHHAGCFSEHGGCTLLGCGGKATLPRGV